MALTDRKALAWVHSGESTSTERPCQCPTPENASVGHRAFLESSLSALRHSPSKADSISSRARAALFAPGNAPTEDSGDTCQERGNHAYSFTHSSGFLTQNRESNLCPGCSSPQCWLHTPLPLVPLLAFTGHSAKPIRCTALAEK